MRTDGGHALARKRAKGIACGTSSLSRGERNIRWIETYCRIPEGKDVGKPVEAAAVAEARDLRRSTTTRPARGGRSCRSARRTRRRRWRRSCCCCICAGRRRCRTASCRARRSRASRRRCCSRWRRRSCGCRRDLDEVVTIRDTLKELHCPELGTRYRALSAEDATAYGLSPIFVIHDELGQVRGPVSKLYNAIETAMGAQEAPLSIIISTQAPTDADLLSMLIDDALTGADPTTVLSLYTADRGPGPVLGRGDRQANPAAGDFLSMQGAAAPGGGCAADAVAGGAVPELYAEPAGRRRARRSSRGRSGRPAAAQWCRTSPACRSSPGWTCRASAT